MTKRFNIVDGVASYSVADGMTASLHVEKAFPGFTAGAETVKQAIIFALKTALRNATAGKMDTAEEIKEAFNSVEKRCAALEGGVWAARREGSGGESRESVLARALAGVMGTTTTDAVAFIDDMVSKALEENGIDPEADAESLSEEEKTKKAEVARTVRKEISKDGAVAIKMAMIKAEDATAKAQTVEKENAGKTSKFVK